MIPIRGSVEIGKPKVAYSLKDDIVIDELENNILQMIEKIKRAKVANREARMSGLHLGKSFFIAALLVSVSPLIASVGIQQICNGPVSLFAVVPILIYFSIFRNAATGGFMMPVIFTAIFLFALFCAFNCYILYKKDDFKMWKLVINRIYLYGVTVLSSLYYGTAWKYGLKYQSYSAVVISAASALIWGAFCFYWMHGARSPRNNFQLLIANSLLFFGVYVFFFPAVGEMP